MEVLRHTLALRMGEDRQVLPVREERRIGAQIGGNFRRLVLLYASPGGLQGVVVPERHLDGLLKCNPDGPLRERRMRQHQATEHLSGHQDSPDVFHRHNCVLGFHQPSKEPSGSGS
ncbi:hypothetical protein SBA5_870005 [Candidatus Sulfotelmatomonas gaucii]|uniref:Uncharacterized protein n=1 Tax=Candidatus Sulfuritelmatomonas gaucii TaxID=2043161 RepID=A0A2N9M738_9BACT|nr:hypothetical protein SBA5_870005 [Candidatus Sulfotelmatomonas gaucii]